MKTACLVCVTLILSTCGVAAVGVKYPECPAGLTCSQVTPLDKPTLTFDCAFAAPANGVEPIGHVYCMHGNDGSGAKAMFAAVMLELANHGYASVSCDNRGFSPGASPNNYSAYNYDVLQTDIFSIVNATNMYDSKDGKFHMVAHDQGARVAWHAIAQGEGRRRFRSFTSLSIPHSDIFSDSLYGTNTQTDEQHAAQYVRILVLPNSTTVYNDALFHTFCTGSGWKTYESCQKILWWYNGAIDSGAMALAPMLPFGAVAKSLKIPEATVRALTQYNITGVPQTVKVGKIDENLPILFACGEGDGSDLCHGAAGDYFEQGSKSLIANFTYLRMKLPCGHDVLGCSDSAQVDQLIGNILQNIQDS
eukprot:g4260.t1